jgi:transposase InsO family protein
MLAKGVPEYIRSDSDAEMTAKIMRNWLGKLEAKTLCIAPGSPWENGSCKSFNGKPRDECLAGEIFRERRPRDSMSLTMRARAVKLVHSLVDDAGG